MNDITPKDQTETAALGAGKRIATAIGIIGAAVPALLAAFGGIDWITANLPLLLTGLGSLASGGVASYIAIRRMSVGRLANGAAKALSLLLMLLPALMLAGCICRKAWLRVVLLLLLPCLFSSGCVAIRANSTDKGASVLAFGWGADSAANLANVAVTGPSTNDSTGVSFDAANSEQQSYKAMQSLVTLGAALAPMLAGGAPAALASTAVKSAAASSSASSDDAPAEDEAETSYSDDGYGGTPAADGAGVYGRPSCARCRAYRAAHPGIELINIDDAGNRADMWAALRLRGFSGTSAALPVEIVGSTYTLSAR